MLLRCKNVDAESITCCIGIFDVAKEKQAQDFDSYHICMCRNCGNNAFHHKVSLFFFLKHAYHIIYMLKWNNWGCCILVQLFESRIRMAPSRSCRFSTLHFVGHGFNQLATLLSMSKTICCLRRISFPFHHIWDYFCNIKFIDVFPPFSNCYYW